MIERIEEKESDDDDVVAVIDVGLRKLNGVRWRLDSVAVAVKEATCEAE